MGMAGHVDRHAVDADRQVGAVIEIKAAQEILVGFSTPECWVTITPGIFSTTSAGRSSARSDRSAALTTP